MSFRKRNVVLGSPNPSSPQSSQQEKTLAPGTRPSPLDGRLTTSTGSSSLDQVLAGHAGLPLGTSLLVEESGTTDFGGILLRYYAAEGLVQGHNVHVLGYGEPWRRELPGLGTEKKSSSSKQSESPDDKMKIAWRYEALSNRGPSSRETPVQSALDHSANPFCHSFDLSKRLEQSAIRGQLHCHPAGDPFTSRPGVSVFTKFITDLTTKLQNSSPSSIHRIVIPSLLSPTLYPSFCCQPQEVLRFLHALRGLLRSFSTRMSVLITLPISLFPRLSGMTRWIELLSDGVLELVPLQQQHHLGRDLPSEEKTQGLLRIHSLPVFHEKGGGLEGGWMREDMSFRLSSSSGLIVTPYSLPPVGETEEEAQKTNKTEGKKESLDF